MRLFFDNGGGACYIVCIGFYRTPVAIRASELENGLDLLTAYQEPTMIAVPDVASLSRQDAASLSQQVLKHCSTRKSRVAILDIFPGETAINHNDPIGKFRDGIGEVGLDFGAAYYPWIETSVVEADEINAGFLTPRALGKVVEKVNAYIKAMPDQKSKDALSGFLSVVAPTASSGAPPAPAGGGDAQPGPVGGAQPAPAGGASGIQPLTLQQQNAHNALMNAVPFYTQLMNALLNAVNLLRPSGAVAGVYARNDFTRGVFKAPSGTSILSAVKPTVPITDEDQENLDVPLSGKAINAIRAIPGSGVMVWGARTLNDNSQDTRYINVRRTMIMLEQSIGGVAKMPRPSRSANAPRGRSTGPAALLMRRVKGGVDYVRNVRSVCTSSPCLTECSLFRSQWTVAVSAPMSRWVDLTHSTSGRRKAGVCA